MSNNRDNLTNKKIGPQQIFRTCNIADLKNLLRIQIRKSAISQSHICFPIDQPKKKIIIKNVSNVPRKKEANKKTRKPLSLNPLKSCSEAIPTETRINKGNKR